MCDLCTLRAGSKAAGDTDEDKTLAFAGSIRRRLIHKNKTSSKRARVPDSVRTREWKAIDNKKKKSRQKIRKPLRDLFEREIQLLVDRLKEKTGQKAVAWAYVKMASGQKAEDILPLVTDILLNWTKWFSLTKDTIKEEVEDVADDGFKAGLDRIGTQGPEFTSSRPPVRTVLDEILEQAAGTQQTFRDVTARTIQRRLSAGDDMPAIVRAVAEKTQEQVGHRLDRLVQTAGHGAFEAGQRESFLQAGIDIIDWLTQRDPRVRSPNVGDTWDHRDMDRQEVRIQEKFTVTGKGGRQEQLWHPGDPNGSPGNVIRCRCTITAVE